LYYCWKTQKTTEHFSYSTEYLSVPTVNKLPLQFIPFTNEKLRYKYSSLTTQFTISERAYTFLKTLEKQNENQGTLFTSQPFQVRGNLVNTNNPDEPVLGYFMVAAGTKSNRLFVIAPPRVRYSLTHCEADTTINTIRNALNQYTYNNKPIYFTIVYLTNPELPDMEEVEVPKYSWAVLKKLKETHIRQITNTSVIGITKKDGKFISMPKGDVLITSECKLLVIGLQSDIKTTKELLRKRTKPKELRFV